MPSVKPTILVCGALVWANNELATMSEHYTIKTLQTSVTRPQFIAALNEQSGEFGDIVAIYRHNSSADHVGVFDKELVEAFPSTLKYVCHNGAGYDQIDIQACTAKGIQVSNTPSAVDDATATVGMYLIISAMRQFYKAEMCARAGQFKTGTKPAHDPELKTLGIVGMGGIGRALAKRALGFDMKVIYHNRNPVDPSLLAAFPDGAISYVPTLDELLQTSDVVSLNLPLNASTRNSFGKRQFSLMKRGSVLVNTARGGVVDEPALLEALETGHLASAGLDVYPNEPEINPRLLANDKLTLLPHMGTETEESQHKMEALALSNIEKALAQGTLITPVWEQKGKF
ncbi:hypothetical protein OIO90_003998 [Microbotryomycetes sp. JL221]|nr:hypothetical protein OIO90_003998 [Microbotryomycetes sp. JL221]